LLSDGTTLYVPGVGQWNGTSWAYELPDGLGSVRQLSDAQGNIIQRYEYSPFGEVLAAQGQRPSALQYTGEQKDLDTGLIYLRARWYDPATGRFTTRDPFPGFAVLPQTLHPYVYVGNNPVNLVDPSGKFAFLPLLVVAILGGIIGGVSYYTIQAIINADPCLGVQWHWQEALFWGTAGAGLGGLIGTGIYGGWWIGAHLGWWGVGAGGATAAHQIVARGGIDPVRIGQEGVQFVLNLLRQAGEGIVKLQAYYRTPNGRAFIDIETQNFLIEVKNLSTPTLSQTFIDQAEKYLQISRQVGKPLIYYFTNQPPNAHMIEFLRRLNIIWFHTPISGGG
jgi:RHS repeat-associated protein